jgi:hypothetical protein
MSRYQIGEKIVVGFHELSGQRVQAIVGNLFKPWQDKLLWLHLLELTCVEHHQVFWEYDEKKESPCDGFVFEDKHKRRWYNQYPRASYSQLSTSADWYFALSRDNGYPGRTDELHYFEDITVTIDRMTDGSQDFVKLIEGKMTLPGGHKTTPADIELWKQYQTQLLNHRTYVIKRVEKDFGVRVEIKPIVFQHKDGTGKEVPEIQKASLVYPSV